MVWNHLSRLKTVKFTFSTPIFIYQNEQSGTPILPHSGSLLFYLDYPPKSTCTDGV